MLVKGPLLTNHNKTQQSTRCGHIYSHDDVIKWKYFPRYWPFVRGIHRSPVNSPHKGQWRGALVFSLICTRINGWVNNGEAGDLKCHRAHYDVTVMGMYWWPYFVAIVNSLKFMRTPGKNFSEILSEIQTFSFKKMHLKMSFAKWWQLCPGLNVLKSTALNPSNTQ